VAYLTEKALAAAKESDPKAAVAALEALLKGEQKNIKALVGGGGLEAALFGFGTAHGAWCGVRGLGVSGFGVAESSQANTPCRNQAPLP
jgi:hypothetical protein